LTEAQIAAIGTTGNIIGGTAGGFASGTIAGGNLRSGFQGSLSGGLFGGVNSYTQYWSAPGQIGAKAFTGGILADLQGGDFRTGFIYSGSSATAAWSYEKIVGYGATWRPGGEAVEKLRYTPPVAGSNNFGIQWTDGAPNWLDKLFWEGGPVSKVMNALPGFNAGAGMHDTFQVVSDAAGGNLLRNLVNLPGVPVAALMTAPALFDPLMPYVYLSDIK
jgi:hypothetical protein